MEDIFQKLSSLIYKLELICGALFICWFLYYIPTLTHFLRTFITFVSCPLFVFIFFHLLILFLAFSLNFFKQQDTFLHPKDTQDHGIGDCSFFQNFVDVDDGDEEMVVVEKNIVVEDKKVISCDTKIEENKKDEDDEVETLSHEEFNKKIETFIQEIKTFRRQESWLDSFKEDNI